MKRLGGFTRRFRYAGEDLARLPFPDFDLHREEIVGGSSGVESTTQKAPEGVGGVVPSMLGREISDEVEQQLDRYLDQLHIWEGCPHTRER